MTGVRVKIIVLEDNLQVAEIDLTYPKAQEYVVQVVSPDGIDSMRARKAGNGNLLSLASSLANDQWSVKA